MKIRKKIFYSYFLLGLGLISICTFVLYTNFSNAITDEVENRLIQESINKKDWLESYFDERVGDINVLATSTSVSAALNEKLALDVNYATQEIEKKAKEVAEEVGLYIKSNPTKTVKDFQNDPNFQKIAVQKVGMTGYTALTDYETLICRFHNNPDIVDFNLESLSEKLPGFWGVMSKSQGGTDSKGFYDWEESDGSIKRKYMYIAVVDALTADNVGMTVAATTYIDEYPVTIKMLDDARVHFDSIVQKYGYEDLYIVNNSGQIVYVSSKNSLLESNLNDSENSKNLLAKVYNKIVDEKSIVVSDIGINVENTKQVSYIGAPVLNNIEGDFLGVVLLEINKDSINSIVQNRNSFEEIGQTYLVGSDNFMRSDLSNSEESVVLKEKVDNEVVNNCFNDKDNNNNSSVSKVDNFQNVSVLSTYQYIPTLNWCLITEIDKFQAYNKVNRTLWFSVLIGFVLIFLFYFAAKYISGTICQPISELQNGINLISKGNLKYKVALKTNDEIGDLSRSFDKLTKAIVNSRKEVDKRVEKQTKEIKTQKQKLEQQHKAILNVLEDIELEKENLESEKDKIDAILHSIGDGVFVVDKNKKLVLLNDAALDISGFSSKELIGKNYFNILKFVDENTQKKRDDFISKCMKSGKIQSMRRDTILLTKDGKKVPVADSAAPLINKNGDILGCVVVFHDVTKERQIDRAKTEFVSLASHQLRTPLTSINWYVEMLLKGDAGKLKNEQQEFLNQIYSSNKRMIDLVDALLNVSRLELGTFDLEIKNIKLKELTKSVVQEMQNVIKKKNINFNQSYGDKIPNVQFDERLMRIIFQNLISNALKYTPKGGDVSVEIINKKSDIYATVTDTGLGIPKSEYSRMFTKMFRATNVQKKSTTGTGLGLYIVKSIIDQMGGKIWFESEIDKGTTFSLLIPKRINIKKEE